MSGAALVGHTGFVGSNLLRCHAFEALYNSRNVEEISGNSFDLLVFSAAQAKKWWANQNPQEDWAGIERGLQALDGVRSERVVLISTIDVVPPGAGVDETAAIAGVANHAYGENRFRLEQAFRARFEQLLIVRLPALFGPGLKKNVVYDLMHDNLLEQINRDSSFQYYDLTRLWSDIQLCQDAGVDLVHLVTEPLATGELIDKCFNGKPVGGAAAPAAQYDFRTRHDGLFAGAGGYIEDRASVLNRLQAFILSERA